MFERLTNAIAALVLATLIFATGCEPRQMVEENVLDYVPDINAIVVLDDFTPGAIEAAGGYGAWLKTIRLQRDCIVTFYKPDGSFYLTEQRHEIYPWSNSIVISALEPQGKFTWQLSKGQFSTLDGAELVDVLPIKIDEPDYAVAILDLTTAPARFMDKDSSFVKEDKPVKIEGLWRYPIQLTLTEKTGVYESFSKVVFYQNRDGSLVDMVWFVGADKKKLLAVRGYDYQAAEKGSVLLAAKIEIFKTDARGTLTQRLVKIDYK